jgi:hypothetical protein
MDNSRKYFCGIDPGKTGGIGVIDAAGRFIAAHRWHEREPIKLYNILLLIKGCLVNRVYLELIQVFPQKESGFIQQGQSTIANWGIWQGFMIAAGVPYDVVSPLTWQAAYGLTSWAKKQADGISCHSPLTLARHLWPTAPLPCLADDGKAVGLILADLARRDHFAGIDRGALRNQAQAKAKAKKAQARKLAKNSLAFDIGWPPITSPASPHAPKK